MNRTVQPEFEDKLNRIFGSIWRKSAWTKIRSPNSRSPNPGNEW